MDAGNLSTDDGPVGEGSGDTEDDCRFFDGHGQALFWSVLDDRPSGATVNVQLFPAEDFFGLAECIGVLVSPVELSDRDGTDGDTDLQFRQFW